MIDFKKTSAEYWEGVQAGFLETIRREYRDGARASYLLTRQSAKTVKGEKYGILTGVLYLSPYKESGYNLCPFASPGCIGTCLGHSSGRMKFDGSKRARILRTLEYMLDRDIFMARLEREIRNMVAYGKRKGMRVFIRLNGTSDIDWTSDFPGLFELFPTVQFYDYTKDLSRMDRRLWPDNYHCTYSYSENTNPDYVRSLLGARYNVAVVYLKTFPETGFGGFPVVNGDETDARPDDKNGVIVGLKAKGSAKRDKTGFVVR